MKLQSLNTEYLKGVLDTFISLYDKHVRPIPAEAGLEYEIQTSTKEKNSAKITFTWVIAGESKVTDIETNSHESRGELCDDHFTIVLGEDITKIESYVNDVLDKVTNK
jgi:hypothetical protein